VPKAIGDLLVNGLLLLFGNDDDDDDDDDVVVVERDRVWEEEIV